MLKQEIARNIAYAYVAGMDQSYARNYALEMGAAQKVEVVNLKAVPGVQGGLTVRFEDGAERAISCNSLHLPWEEHLAHVERMRAAVETTQEIERRTEQLRERLGFDENTGDVRINSDWIFKEPQGVQLNAGFYLEMLRAFEHGLPEQAAPSQQTGESAGGSALEEFFAA